VEQGRQEKKKKRKETIEEEKNIDMNIIFLPMKDSRC